MSKSKKMSESDKSKILVLRNENLSLREISARVSFSKSAVGDFLKKFDVTGSLKRKNGSGGIKKTTAREDRLLERISLRNRFETAEDVRAEFVKDGGSDITTRTVRRRLREAGLCARRPAKKPLLTTKMRRKRLNWAKQHENWTRDDWRKVIFSDESKINLFGSDGIMYVRRRTGERFSEDCLRRTVRQGGSRMIWGCFSYYGVGQLALIDGNVNAIAYQRILEENLIPSIEEHFSQSDDLVFQDDSAPCHRAKLVKTYLSKVGIVTMDWPGNSPDLNPIENLWFIMKMQVRKMKPQTLSELDLIVEKVWFNGIGGQTIQNLVDSMPERIQAVIKKKGGSTKY